MLRPVMLALTLLLPIRAADKPDNSALLRSLQDRAGAQDRTIYDLRNQLDRSRSTADSRVQAAKAPLESLTRTMQFQLDQARTETYTARTVSASKDVVIEQLTAELDKVRRSDASVAAVQDTAVKTAVKVASVRHAQDAKDLKTGVSLAGAAAVNSEESARLSKANRDQIETAKRDITKLTDIVRGIAETETLGWRLMVMFVCVMLALIVVAGMIFWKLFHLIRTAGGGPALPESP